MSLFKQEAEASALVRKWLVYPDRWDTIDRELVIADTREYIGIVATAELAELIATTHNLLVPLWNAYRVARAKLEDRNV